MQEEIEHKTVNFAISTTKLTARTFLKGAQFLLRQYANSTQDNEYMTGEQSYHYYNEFLWPDRYADCVPMDKALELLKK